MSLHQRLSRCYVTTLEMPKSKEWWGKQRYKPLTFLPNGYTKMDGIFPGVPRKHGLDGFQTRHIIEGSWGDGSSSIHTTNIYKPGKSQRVIWPGSAVWIFYQPQAPLARGWFDNIQGQGKAAGAKSEASQVRCPGDSKCCYANHSYCWWFRHPSPLQRWRIYPLLRRKLTWNFENHPFEKENHLPNLHFCVPC